MEFVDFQQYPVLSGVVCVPKGAARTNEITPATAYPAQQAQPVDVTVSHSESTKLFCQPKIAAVLVHDREFTERVAVSGQQGVPEDLDGAFVVASHVTLREPGESLAVARCERTAGQLQRELVVSPIGELSGLVLDRSGTAAVAQSLLV